MKCAGATMMVMNSPRAVAILAELEAAFDELQAPHLGVPVL